MTTATNQQRPSMSIGSELAVLARDAADADVGPSDWEVKLVPEISRL